jgi:hypothetical protein
MTNACSIFWETNRLYSRKPISAEGQLAAQKFCPRGGDMAGSQFCRFKYRHGGLFGVVLSLVLCAGAGSADAQHAAEALSLSPMNFDMWCQETRGLSPARCDQRIPMDDAAFQAFSNTIETYEILGLRARAKDREINQDILHYDPVDHPTEFSAPQTDRPNRGD